MTLSSLWNYGVVITGLLSCKCASAMYLLDSGLSCDQLTTVSVA